MGELYVGLARLQELEGIDDETAFDVSDPTYTLTPELSGAMAALVAIINPQAITRWARSHEVVTGATAAAFWLAIAMIHGRCS